MWVLVALCVCLGLAEGAGCQHTAPYYRAVHSNGLLCKFYPNTAVFTSCVNVTYGGANVNINACASRSTNQTALWCITNAGSPVIPARLVVLVNPDNGIAAVMP